MRAAHAAKREAEARLGSQFADTADSYLFVVLVESLLVDLCNTSVTGQQIDFAITGREDRPTVFAVRPLDPKRVATR